MTSQISYFEFQLKSPYQIACISIFYMWFERIAQKQDGCTMIIEASPPPQAPKLKKKFISLVVHFYREALHVYKMFMSSSYFFISLQ